MIDELHIRGLSMMLTVALIVMIILMRGAPRWAWQAGLVAVFIALALLSATPYPRALARMIVGDPAS